MSDSAIRQAEREGGGLLARYRAGQLEVAYPCAPGVRCTGLKCALVRSFDGVGHPADGECRGSGRDPADPEDLLRLLAFCGVEEARALVPPKSMDYGGWGYVDSVSLTKWLGYLTRLLAKLPARRVRILCDMAEHHDAIHDPCPACQGTSLLSQDTPADCWLLAAACVAVGRECLALAMEATQACSFAAEWAALDAAEAWAAEPTQERLPPWEDALGSIEEAVEILGETRVRELVCAEIVRRVLGTNQQAKGTKE